MKNNMRPIALIDSGIGGVSFLLEAKKRLSLEDYVYISDSRNMPYGSKSREELLHFSAALMRKADALNPKCIVVACNTLSLNCLSEMQKLTESKVFGVYPRINTANNNSRQLVIGTPRTIEALKSMLGEKAAHVDMLPLSGLASEIERNIFSLERVSLPFVFNESYTAVYAACTHYSFVKREISSFYPKAEIFDGILPTLDEMTAYLLKNNLLSPKQSGNISFYGDCSKKTETVFYFFGGQKSR